MKKLIFAVCAVFMMNAHAMEKDTNNCSPEIVITEPYTPSLIVQHPRLIKAAIWTSVGVTGLYSYLNAEPISAVGTLALAAYLWKNPRKERLVDTLLVNPSDALDAARKIDQQFFDEIKKNDLEKKPIQAFESWITTKENELKKISPIFLLNECTDSQFRKCTLAGQYDDKARAIFEKKVVEALQQKMQITSKTIEYVSFGSGELFPDLAILTRLCAQNPQVYLNMHCIDIENAPLTTIAKEMKISRELNAHLMKNGQEYYDNFVQMIEKDIDMKNDPVINRPDFLAQQCLIKNMRGKQLLDFISCTFPESKIELYSYATHKDYSESSNIIPDVIAAVDIDDAASMQRGAAQGYKALCTTFLQKNKGLA
jgi:hypothetical protein